MIWLFCCYIPVPEITLLFFNNRRIAILYYNCFSQNNVTHFQQASIKQIVDKNQGQKNNLDIFEVLDNGYV